MCAILAGSTPGPSSSICSSTVSALAVRVTMIVPPRGEKLMAFSSTFCSTISSMPWPARTIGALVEAADQPDVLAGQDLAEVKRRVADQLGEVGRHARRLDQVGGADVVPLGGDHQVEQAGQRGIDDLERAAGALVVGGTARRTGSSAERMAASGVLKECALSSADWRICCETRRRSCTSLSKSRATLDSSGTTLRWREGVVADAALADLGGDVAKAAQAEADADGDQQGEHGEHEVDGGRDPDLAGLPIGPADRGVEEFRGRVGRGQHPAARGGADRE